jgi:hypothetical protein
MPQLLDRFAVLGTLGVVVGWLAGCLIRSPLRPVPSWLAAGGVITIGIETLNACSPGSPQDF